MYKVDSLIKFQNKEFKLSEDKYDELSSYIANTSIDSAKEISKILKIPLGTVKSRINRGRFKLKDLLSRLKSFYFIKISDPDDELINHLLLKHLHDRQIIIHNVEIFSYITKRINRTYLDIYNFVEKIDKLSLSQKRQITIPLIKELL